MHLNGEIKPPNKALALELLRKGAAAGFIPAVREFERIQKERSQKKRGRETA
ncbi:hypothetical protein [Candidatus Methanomethylophilus sp. 1R26]|uniref:hypothetical protein n=1 Tax=Candidatus Methanomethylophilus sp. 1R26 TaxID=1769296 RepID=UPI0012FF42F0|nr:hypothetical protein [Candidatus Methanomethylophilus sp. 1R26]